MEKPFKQERQPGVNFLDEKVKLALKIESEAAHHLPEVSQEDLRTRIEKYRILLGKVDIIGKEDAKVFVKGVLDMEGESGFYEEGREAVSGINILAIRRFTQTVQETEPDFKHFGLIGDIHTHPLLPKDFENGLKPWSPSPGDVESVISEYENGTLSGKNPFIFGIAGPDESGETQYAFYRIVKTKDGYKVVEVELE